MVDLKVHTRYAPSPTGDPHIGNIRTALFAYLYARHMGGKFSLRIEDTDKSREIAGSVDRIKESLAWLGITYDGEPVFQSHRLPLYKKAAQQLLEQGHAYYCFCSAERLTEVREAQAKQGQPPMYNKHCRTIPAKEAAKRAGVQAHVIRLAVPEVGDTVVSDFLRGDVTFSNHTIDDQVLLKSDGFPTYHLAVVVDDHDLAITHVMRGEDWLPSAPKHVLLYQYFGWPMPVFLHLSLIVGTDKKKLSKRLGDMSLLAYRGQGFTPLAIINFLVRLGFTPHDDRKLYTLEELAKEFTIEGLHKNPAVFDIEKLHWFNRLTKEQAQDDQGELIQAITKLLQEHNIASAPPTETQYVFIREAAKRIDTVTEAEPMLAYLWQEPTALPVAGILQHHTKDDVDAVLTQAKAAIAAIDPWDEVSIGNAIRQTQRELMSWASKDYYQLLTAALTGSTTAPPLFASILLLGKETCLQRLMAAILKD